MRSIATGGAHTCAVLTDRRVWCWGDAARGLVGAAPTARCVGIRGAADRVTRPHRVEGVDQVERNLAGTSVTCAIRADGAVWCWGFVNGRYTERPVRVEWSLTRTA